MKFYTRLIEYDEDDVDENYNFQYSISLENIFLKTHTRYVLQTMVYRVYHYVCNTLNFDPGVGSLLQ